MTLFFVYDTTYCIKDEDDPKDAVLYFFPPQESESQYFFLCCQLAGVAKFLKSSFSAPSTIGLDQGKFAFLWSGKYLIVLGYNGDIPDNILKDQLNFLSGIFCFYHGSLNNMYKECKDRDQFLERLEKSWSNYISLLLSLSSMFSFSISAINLKPAKKSSRTISASRLLHMCQLSSSVVAGVVFHKNKVLSTQFPPQLTCYLSLFTTTANASASVSNASHDFETIPADTELKWIHLSPKSVSGIQKYNHNSVGSRIRLKTEPKTAHSSKNSGSGSEADIDSGNCSDTPNSRKNPSGKLSTKLLKNNLNRHKKHCSGSCCLSHTKLFLHKEFSSRNLSCLKNLLPSRDVETRNWCNDSSLNPKEKKLLSYQSIYRGKSLLCFSHASYLASSFISQSSKHADFTSTSDAEFRCSLCTNNDGSHLINELSLKKWNSEVNISEFVRGSCICELLPKLKQTRQSSTTKLQVLKCRTRSDPCGKLKHSGSSNLLAKKHSGESYRRSSASSSKSSSKSSNLSEELNADIEDNKLQKHVLYVQKYGKGIVLLLLSKLFDGKILNYLWNSSFTFLRELEFSNDTQGMENAYEALDPSFYILSYNRVDKTIKEYPRFPSLILAEKHTRRNIQKIQGHFQDNSDFRMLCLMSSAQSIYAVNKSPQSSFYLKPDVNGRKLDSLTSLCKKAVKRLDKCLKFND